MRKRESEYVQEFPDRFLKVYSAIPAQLKPPISYAELQYAESFYSEFTLWLSERRSTSLVDMMKDSIKVEVEPVCC